jgi:D-alanine-D-alanine ligase
MYTCPASDSLRERSYASSTERVRANSQQRIMRAFREELSDAGQVLYARAYSLYTIHMITVGIIRGGTNALYDTSLDTGAELLAHLRSDTLKGSYKAIDIFIDKDGLWHMGGIPVSIQKLSDSVDVVFNALHGDFGEDGALQEILEKWHIPYVGSSSASTATSYDIQSTKEALDGLGIQTPKHMLFPAYQSDFDGPAKEYAHAKAKKVWETFAPPWIVKPLTRGSSMGVHVCVTYPELVRAFEIGISQRVSIVVEEMIDGKRARVSVVEKFRDRDLYTFPPLEIRDSESQYPSSFTTAEKKELERLAMRIHTSLGLGHYSHSEFIVHPKRGIYALTVDTVPRITDTSHTPKILATVGVTVPEFLRHLLTHASEQKDI